MKPVGRSKVAARNEAKESLKPAADDRKTGKRKAAAAPKAKARKATKAKKDPNKPKRPPTAFFVFLEEFRSTFKKENPNVKGVAAVGKAGGEKWKSLTAAEKAPYEAKAAKKKVEYGTLMNAYNNKQLESSGDEDEVASEKSTSEVQDDEEEESVQEEADDDDDDDDDDEEEEEEEEEDDEDEDEED